MQGGGGCACACVFFVVVVFFLMLTYRQEPITWPTRHEASRGVPFEIPQRFFVILTVSCIISEL